MVGFAFLALLTWLLCLFSIMLERGDVSDKQGVPGTFTGGYKLVVIYRSIAHIVSLEYQLLDIFLLQFEIRSWF